MNNILDLRAKDDREDETPPAKEPLVIDSEPSGFKKFFQYAWEIIKIVVISLVIIVPIRLYVVQPFIVEGDSMTPNFHDGEYLIVDEISYRFRAPQRGEVVILHPPQAEKTYYIKRVIGLPGETLELRDGRIYIYNDEFPDGRVLSEVNYLTKNQITEMAKVTLKADEYYVFGDNRDNSLDSRRIGPIPLQNIKGRAILRAFPFNKFTIIKAPEYFFRS